MSEGRISTPATACPLAHDLAVTVEDLPPCTEIELRAGLTDEAGVEWHSRGRFVSDAAGRVDSAAQASVGGTYCGVDPGGLFWSVEPAGGRDAWLKRLADGAPLPLAPAIDPLADSAYAISAHWTSGQREAAVSGGITVTRQRLAPDVTRETVRNGRLRGELFLPAQRCRAAALVLGGSEGGLLPTRAAALAAEGIAALSLAYFDHEDLPRAAIGLPLEYFCEAADWLRRRIGGPIAIWGSSRGSEAALLCAAHRPERFDAVIGWVPSHLVNTGFDMAAGRDFSATADAMWTLEGKPLAGAAHPPADEARRRRRQRGFAGRHGYRFADEFVELWLQPGIEAHHRIPVERITAPLLLVSGSADGLWPSTLGAERIAAALARAGRASQVEHLCCEGAGHAIGVPNEPRPFSGLAYWTDGYSGVDGGFVRYGGTPSLNAAATRDAWRAAVRFLRSTLRID